MKTWTEPELKELDIAETALILPYGSKNDGTFLGKDGTTGPLYSGTYTDAN